MRASRREAAGTGVLFQISRLLQFLKILRISRSHRKAFLVGYSSKAMRHFTHLTSTAEALQRVFLLPRPYLARPSILPIPPRRTPSIPLPKRHYATGPQNGAFNMAGRFVRADKLSKSEDQRNRDEGIPSYKICLVQPDGKLGPPQALSYALRMIDRKAEYIEQLNEVDGIPVCKIINKKEAREAAKARKKQKQPSAVTKYLELNWAIDKNDLAHRLGKLREFLEQGRRVEVLLLKKKKRMRDATEEEGRQTLETLGRFVEGVEGAREMRPMEGTFLGRATLFYEGKAKASKENNGKEQVAVAKEEPVPEPTPPSEDVPRKQASYG